MTRPAGPGVLDLVELRRIPVARLGPLLEEETVRWRNSLDWDYAPSAELVTRYVSMHALEGLALTDQDDVAGYCYWVQEGRKAILGGFYVREPFRSPEFENRLLGGTLDLIGCSRRVTPGWIIRVEAQLMQLGIRGSQILPDRPRPNAFPRYFMLAPLDQPQSLPPAHLMESLQLETWNPLYLDDSAQLIADVYQDHVDSEINDQYNSTAGARKFLQNIAMYPGCGLFQSDCSWVALTPQGRLAGMSLATRVSPDCGHVAQLCVLPHFQKHRLGYELIRRSMVSLWRKGCRKVSLTVTAENRRAVGLYDRLGFSVVHEFEALVWGSNA
jgi:ribosomal protein S18 acetylase RimI-like enzyme